MDSGMKSAIALKMQKQNIIFNTKNFVAAAITCVRMI